MKEDRKEVVKAWLDGETIQRQISDGSWTDHELYKDCNSIYFDSCSTYRIKPKNIVTTTFITQEGEVLHRTHTLGGAIPNLKLTWSPDGETLLKAEVI